MVVVWDKHATAELRKLHRYISIDSPQNAAMVADTIVKSCIELLSNPEKYPLDKFKIGNDGSWRAFEKHRYRISYQVLKGRILIARIRHTSRSPQNY